MIYSLTAGVALLLVAAGLYFYIKKRKRSALKAIEVFDVDTVTLHDLVEFFKRPESICILKQSPDKIAVSIKEKIQTGRTNVILTLFDKTTNRIEQPLAVYSAKAVDPELLSLYGDKDMIVIK